MKANLQIEGRRALPIAFVAALGGIFGTVLSTPASAQMFLAPWVGVPSSEQVGAPKDWSHRHLVYSNPDTRDEAAWKGRLALEEWTRNQKDPRFVAQLARKQAERSARQNSDWARGDDRRGRSGDDGNTADPAMHRDWSNVLGGATGVGKAGVYPAKFQFDINATPSCANDFVVYTTASSGATSSGTFASQTGTFTGNPAAGGTLTITRTGAPAPLVLTASATLNTGRNFQVGGGTTANATNLANAIARNGGAVGLTATSAGAVVTAVSLTTGAAGASPTFATTLTNFTGGGAALTGGSGTPGQPTIIAFNQIYSSCGTTPTQAVPATFWSYNTGNAAFAETSPVLSISGAQVAFVQRTGTAASLVLLKWSSASAGTVGAPTVPASATLATYRACTAPCMVVIPFSGNPNNTNSSPYYDYSNDVLYVGADNGTLHKFSGIFNGTPAEVTTGWPVTVSAGNVLSSPVYDSVSNLVFVGSRRTATTSGGMLHSVNATSGALVSSGQLAVNTSAGVRDAPIVDSSAQRVYAFVGSDVSGTGTTCSASPCAAVYQFPTTITGGSTGTKVQIGAGVASTTLGLSYAGTFDNTYYSSANGASPTGSLYVCGSAIATNQRPTLWKIPIANNVMGPITATAAGPTLVSAAANCSPITEIMNGLNDYIYVSVTASGNRTGCTGSCIYMYKLTNPVLTWATTAQPAAGFGAAGGTSGIIVDNISATAGASQIYYSNLTSPGNAVQVSQSALQ